MWDLNPGPKQKLIVLSSIGSSVFLLSLLPALLSFFLSLPSVFCFLSLFLYHKHLLGTSCVPGSVLGKEDKEVSKANLAPCSALCIQTHSME